MPAIRAMTNRTRLVDDYDAPLQPNSIEANLYAYGTFFVMANGPGSNVGRLWIDYVIDATMPREARDPETVSAQIACDGGAATPFDGTVNQTLPSHVQAISDQHFVIRRPGSYLMTQQISGADTVAENYCVHPTVVTTSGYDPTLPPTYKKYTAGAGDSGHWQINGNATRGTATQLITVYQPTTLNPVPSIASSGATTITHYTIRFSPFSHDTFGWVDDVVEEEYDHCEGSDAHQSNAAGKRPA
jgi:hypothetical protein